MNQATMSANQMYKMYKDEGGTLNFSGWLNREKKKGVIPESKQGDEESYASMSGMSEKPSKSTIFGFPTTTLIITGAIIVGAVVVVKLMKKK
jgi:hypothetical protein